MSAVLPFSCNFAELSFINQQWDLTFNSKNQFLDPKLVGFGSLNVKIGLELTKLLQYWFSSNSPYIFSQFSHFSHCNSRENARNQNFHYSRENLARMETLIARHKKHVYGTEVPVPKTRWPGVYSTEDSMTQYFGILKSLTTMHEVTDPSHWFTQLAIYWKRKELNQL